MASSIVVALDWTPNTNHSGFFVAQHEGLYAAAGLDVTLRSPDDAQAAGRTPGRQVAEGLATFAIAPSETALSFATAEEGQPALVAVAAVCQGSTSAICTLKSSGIDSPGKLAGKQYASYGGRFEDAIVSRMVANDGGTSQVLFHPLEFHGYDEDKTMNVGSVVASHLEQGRSDATWIFPAWEGILAARAGQELNLFKLEDFGIPYGYSPVLLAQRTALEEGPALERTRAFLAATAEGYKRAAADPHRAAAALCATGHASLSDAAFVEASAAAIAGSYLDPVAGQWGSMDAARWEAFVDFLSNAAILVNRANEPIPRTAVDVAALFSNVALPSP